MTARFELHVAVDWSARSAPSPARPSRDSIWIGVVSKGRAALPAYYRTRAAAIEALADLILEALARGERALIGFDFPFGYPSGFAARLTGSSCALDLWDWFGARVADGPDNANDRYSVAAAINAAFGGGPFWGRPAGTAWPCLPISKSERRDVGLPEFRLVERQAPGAKSCWQLAYAGSVGSQAIVGIARLSRLRRDPRFAGSVAIWPFESGLAAPEAPVTFAEIYPSLLAREVVRAAAPGETRDSAQVRVTAAALSGLDKAGSLDILFGGAEDLSDEARALVANEEGWILGAGHIESLRAAAA